LQTFIEDYGYLAIFVLMLAESACIPIPSEVTMVFGGALAGGAVASIHLNLALVVVAGVAGNVAGSYLAWALGRWGGRPAWRRWGRYLLLREDDIDRAQRWFDRHGPGAVFFGRLLPVIRTFISLPAGFAGMRPLRFGIYTTAGCIPWTLGLAYAGYFLGANWQSVVSAFHGPTYVLAAVIIVLLVAGVIILVRRRRRERPGSPGARGGLDGSRDHEHADRDRGDAAGRDEEQGVPGRSASGTGRPGREGQSWPR
jgi:membrane protein DedA with SNARE-associated domain